MVSGGEGAAEIKERKPGDSKREHVLVGGGTSLGNLGRPPVGAGRISGSAEASGVGFSIGRMEKTTSRKLARARLLERQQAAAAAREARERANISDLTEFTVRAAQADEIDEWLTTRIEKLKAEADRRRHGHQVAAGKALHAMRLRGESVSAIAAQTGLSLGRVREYLRAAADTAPDALGEVNVGDAQVVPMPSHGVVRAGGHVPGGAVASAQ